MLTKILSIFCPCSILLGSSIELPKAEIIRNEWIQSEVHNSVQKIVIGNEIADLNWNTPAILFFRADGNLDGLSPTHMWRFEEQVKDDTGYLSNYYPQEIIVDNRSYKSSENYYQAIKFELDSPIYNDVVSSSTPAEAKAIAHANINQANLGDDQEMSRRMKRALWAKFVTPDGRPNELGKRLLATDRCPIFEGNKRMTPDGTNISDQRWGMEFDFSLMLETTTMTGKNLLGKLLMELRAHLQKL